MAHFVFGAPDRDGLALHERLRSELGQRGHRVSVLHTDPARHLLWPQHEGAALMRPRRRSPTTGERDLLSALATAGGDASGASALRLARWLEPLRAWFAAAGADLLLLHQQRNPLAQLLQFLARKAGARVVWIGDGLLPHTLQIDEAGLDGDAAATRHSPYHYRVVRADPQFLETCLVHALAAPTPFAPGLRTPDLWQGADWRILPTLLRSHGPGAVLRALLAKPGPMPEEAAIPPGVDLPAGPYLAVILQADDDPRVQLDGGGATRAALLAASSAASRSSGLPLVLVPPAGPAVRHLRTLRQRRDLGTLVPRAAAPAVVAAAAATLTINDPLAAVALLAGTQVLHAGRALYGLRGVTTRATLREFPEALAQIAAARDHATLRTRFLTWLFQHGHVWCSAKAPDHNGMLGLVMNLTGRFASTRGAPPSRYRIGPPWPLANPRRD